MAKDGYKTLRIPNELAGFAEDFIKNHPEFKSKIFLTRQAIIELIHKYSEKGKE